MSLSKCLSSAIIAVLFNLCVLSLCAQEAHKGYGSAEITVLDAEGNPIPKFQLRVIKTIQGMPQFEAWKWYENGKASLDIHDMWFSQDNQAAGVEQIIEIKAAGQSTTSIPLPQPMPESKKFEQSVKMLPGQTVSLIIHDHEGKPLLQDASMLPYTPDEQKSAMRWMQLADTEQAKQFCSLPIEIKNPGQVTITLPANERQYYLLINDERIMRGCRLGPFTVDTTTTKTITLPKPAQLTISMRHPESLGAPMYDTCQYNLMIIIADPEETYGIVANAFDLKPNFRGDELKVFPGEYRASVATFIKAKRGEYREDIDPARFRDSRSVTLEPGKQEEIAFEYKAFDPDAWKGERKVEVEVKKSDGQPGAGIPYDFSFHNRNFGAVSIAKGITPQDGKLVFEGLREGETDGDSKYYSLALDNRKRGYMGIELTEGKPEKQYTLMVAPQTGELAPDIEMEDLFSGEKVRLEQFRGKIVYIDFWASWCGPCQQPMAELQKVWMEKNEMWDGKVVLLGASIDDRIETIRRHVTKAGWNKTRQYWCPLGEETRGFESPAARAYGISGIPTAVIIDPKGMIHWRGHPSEIDLVKEIEGLIAKGK